MSKLKANGILVFPGLSRILLVSPPEAPGFTLKVLAELAHRKTTLQFIAETVLPDGSHHLVVCVEEKQLELALKALSYARKEGETVHFDVVSGLDVLAVYGPHFREKPGPAFLAYQAFAKAQVPVIAISTSFSAVAFLVDRKLTQIAIEALKGAFDLPEEAVLVSSEGCSRPA